jgi:hypothetical protein
MSELEKDFEKTIVKINEKLQEAAKALKKANTLAGKIGFKHGLIFGSWAKEYELNELEKSQDEDSEEDPYDILQKKYEQIDVSALEEAMSEAGWSSSSSYC